MKEKKQYYYRIHGRHYEICMSSHTDGSLIVFGSRVPGEKTYTNREEARKRVYELNGWRYPTNEKAAV